MCLSYSQSRFYSLEDDEHDASEGKHAPIKDAATFDKGKMRRGEVRGDSKHCDEHARLGEHDQEEWLNNEKLSIDSERKESPFLIKRERFKNKFLQRVLPWEKIAVSWKTFPYHIQYAAAHLKHKDFTSSYGAWLPSSSGRILLQSFPGTELYHERLVKALARDLEVPLLVLDNSVLAPYDFSQDCDAESELEDENAESEEECTSEPEIEDENDASNEEECASSNEAKSEDSDNSVEVELEASAKALKVVLPCTLEEFAQGGKSASTPSLRPLKLDYFIQAKAKVGASVAYDATSMNELRRWNDQYGEGGSRRCLATNLVY